MSDLRVNRMSDGGYLIIDSEQTKELTKVVVITQNGTYECKKPDRFPETILALDTARGTVN